MKIKKIGCKIYAHINRHIDVKFHQEGWAGLNFKSDGWRGVGEDGEEAKKKFMRGKWRKKKKFVRRRRQRKSKSCTCKRKKNPAQAVSEKKRKRDFPP